MKVRWKKLLCSALLVCGLTLALGAGALAETPSEVQTLVEQGTALAGMTREEVEALQTQVEAALADAQGEDAQRLDNLQAAIENELTIREAAANGTLSQLPQTGVENSGRYQNGVAVDAGDFAAEDGVVTTFNASRSGQTHWGIDVSYHQGEINWQAVKDAGVEFAILRCGYGSEWDGNGEYNQDDAYWERNASECERLGIPYGVYLYSYATDESMARSEAQHVLRLLQGHHPTLPVFYDMEDNRIAAAGSATLANNARVFCDIIQQNGYRAGIYSYQNFWKAYLTDSVFTNSGWYRWVACYNAAIFDSNGDWDMWQYGGEYVNGVSGAVDVNYWYGDLPGGSNVNPLPEDSRTQVTEFVTRLYKVCLNRSPDATGLNDWVNQLMKGTTTGSQAAYGFVFSNEFKGKNYCNEDYVKQLYRAFLGREADSSGLANWVTQLESGKTREEVFNGFAQSNEFKSLCSSYHLTVGSPIAIPQYGTVPTGSCSVCGKQDGVTGFVTRLYEICLDRKPDSSGLKNWTNQLWSHANSGRDVAFGFIFSDEFQGKNYDNATYVEYLYKAFLGRGSDPTGKANWTNQLAQGVSRQQIFEGFVGSDEFTKICQSYGIVRG